MKDKDELDPSEQLTADTFKRAEELCARLSSTLTLDKRGHARYFNGALVDLGSVSRRETLLTVADFADQPWLTLITEGALPLTEQGLLVYKVPPNDDRRYVGRIRISRPGRRHDDAPDRHFAVFEIVHDARRERRG